ncbi:phosphoribosylformylglycinamidine synthase subunit PurL [Candidatus Woesearchaeota archaeon]|nr:phosphoribosylformylglycinamidine synthase subunit PurL [Candidatus Woesearchaeota archaeon]
MWAVEVFAKKESKDENLVRSIHEDLGIDVKNAYSSNVYYFYDDCTEQQKKDVAEKVLTDPVIQDHAFIPRKKEAWIVEVAYKPNVTDPIEQSIIKAVNDIGVEMSSASAAVRYFFPAEMDENEIRKICTEMLANEQVQEYRIGKGGLKAEGKRLKKSTSEGEVKEIELLGADDDELLRISREGILSLNLAEMKQIRDYFEKEKRNPTDAELETIAQTWSEHCKHKTFTGDVLLVNNGKEERIKNLLKSTIMAATNDVGRKRKWLVSVFKDNAGIIKFDENYHLAFKVETHNHPSALDPYGGSATGIGGVIRDVLGAGLGAKPVFNTDVFCFAMPDYNEKLPKHILHPKRTFKGVVAGVRDYGNRMGIPTINGSIHFHERYLGSPLVFCGTGGIMKKGDEEKKPKKGDLVVTMGGKTGRDGIHGVTFASVALEESSPTTAVQIGNPIEEKRMLDALLQALDKRLYTAITDCGGGGFSSAIGEMGKELGVEVWLDKAPLKYMGLKPWEIWVSESQERMIVSVPEKNIEELKKICGKEGTEMSIIGRFTGDKKLVIKYKEKLVVDLEMPFLHGGLPKEERKAVWESSRNKEPDVNEKESYDEDLKKILSNPTVASKEWVVRQYDHEVQGCSIMKPLLGANNDGPGDASIIKPFESEKAVAVSNGMNIRYGLVDSYWMAASAIDEALRNLVAVGGNIEHTALLDNFCWGNTDQPEKLGSLVMAARACRDIGTKYSLPFISGKDSLHNEIMIEGKGINIPDTLLISAISVMDPKNAVSMDIKEDGSVVFIVGKTYDELGASQFYNLFGEIGLNVPKVRPKEGLENMEKLSRAISKGLVRSCHDCSEGGVAVALAEMCFAGGIGMSVCLDNVPFEGERRDYKVLFSESNSRFIVEVAKGKEGEFTKIMGNSAAIMGKTGGKAISVESKGKTIISSDIKELKEAWQRPLKW